MINPSVKCNNAQIIEPCFIGENVVIENSIIDHMHPLIIIQLLVIL